MPGNIISLIYISVKFAFIQPAGLQIIVVEGMMLELVYILPIKSSLPSAISPTIR